MSTRAGSYGHWEEDAKAFASWGVDWVKQDWCGVPHGLACPDAAGNMSAALNATGRHIALNICRGCSNLFDVAQSWRIMGDHAGTWKSTKDTIAHMASIPREHGGKPYGWNGESVIAV